MKKILFVFAAFMILTGCGNTKLDNTPTKKVEEYFNKYQTLDQSVMDDLDNVLAGDTTLSDDDRDDYREFMKKHYQDLKYKIKNEKIDGDTATVETQITVRDYTKAVNNAVGQKEDGNFTDDNGDVDTAKFSNYRLMELKKVKDTKTYTLNLTLTKQNDEWVLDQLSDEDLNKINGLYSE
jgi:hypothetical protein